MANYIRKPGWSLPDRIATPEAVYLNRRHFIQALGAAAAITGVAALPQPARAVNDGDLKKELAALSPLSGKPNAEFKLDLPPTPPLVAAQYNNFYEFTTDKDVYEYVAAFNPRPWQLEVGGMVEHPKTYDVDELIRRMPLEERTYRLRCVEAWSMVVPWVGFPLSALMKEARPLSSAKYLKLTTFLRPQEAPRQGRKALFFDDPWPYTEGLTIAEASNELALLGVGMYGKVLARQHGAPIRLVVPWKYGFKNIKSVVKIEFVADQPKTFWNTLVPHEYGFVSNVDPRVPHPRWSQAYERDIATGERKPTLLYNGYEKYVASLYANMPVRLG